MTNSLRIFAAYGPLIALIAVAAATDLRARRIPNWLTLTVAVSGVAQSFTSLAVTTPAQSLWGLAAGFGATFALYLLGGRGAGDVKLTAGIGAWLGPAAVIAVLLAGAIVSLVIILVQCAARKRLGLLFRNAAMMVISVVNIRRLGAGYVITTGRGVRSIDRPLPNAVSMLIATLAVVIWLARGTGAVL